MICRAYGILYKPVVIKLDMAERIHYLKVLEIRRHKRLCRQIILIIGLFGVCRRLVGYMEIAFAGNAQTFKLCRERRQKLRQKIFVHIAHCLDMPAEQLFIPAVNTDNNLGTCTNAPLGEQVRHLKIFYTVFAAKLYPASQKRKIKIIPVARFDNTDKLHCRALCADCRVKRRREKRRQKHGNTGACGCLYKLLDKPPVPLAHHFDAEVIGNGVTVKPLCENKVAFFNYSILDTDNNPYLGLCLILNIGECYADGIIARLRIRRNVNRKPQRIGIVSVRTDNIRSLYGIQHIGEKPGLFCYVIVVASFKISGHLRGHMPDPRRAYAAKQLGAHRHFKLGHRTELCIFDDNLKRRPLAACGV